MIVIASYDDNSAGRRNIQHITSDDWGVTWSTNGGAGFDTWGDLIGGNDSNHPWLVQDEVSGELHLFYEYNGAASIRYQTGFDDEDNPTFTIVPGNGLDVSAGAGAAGDVYDPTAWKQPGGPIVVVFSRFNAGDVEVWQTILGTDWDSTDSSSPRSSAVMYSSRIATTTNGLVATASAGIGIVQGRSGHLHIALVDHEAAPDEAVHIPCKIVSQPMSWSYLRE